MQFRQLRVAGVSAIFLGILIGNLLGCATPTFLNPIVEPSLVGGIFLMVLFFVIIPAFGYLEITFFWERSRFQPKLKKLGQSPQIGLGILAPTSIGLAIGLGLGWGLPNLG